MVMHSFNFDLSENNFLTSFWITFFFVEKGIQNLHIL